MAKAKKEEAPKAEAPKAEAPKEKLTTEQVMAKVAEKEEEISFGGEKWEVKSVGGLEVVLVRKGYR